MSSVKVVSCPVCGNNVRLAQINPHLDSNCTTNKVSDTSSPYFVEKTITKVSPDFHQSKKKSILSLKSKREEEKLKKSKSPVKNGVEVDKDDASKSDKSESEEIKTKRCYVLEDFTLILKTVLSDDNEICLFDEWDKKIIDNFFNLSDDAKKFYVKMYQRKLQWNKLSKVDYPEITTDLHVVIEELKSAGFVETELNDLHLILEMMSLPELKSLIKDLKLNQYSINPKLKMVELIKKHCREQKCIFSSSNNMEKIVIQKARKILGTYFQIETESRRVFNRVLMLFSLTSHNPADDRTISGNPALFILFSVNSGKVVYPKYSTLRESKIFCNRDDFVRYELFIQLEQDLLSLFESSKLTETLDLFENYKESYVTEIGESLSHVLSLPVYLKRYSSTATLIRCQNIIVDTLQRLHRYEEAVNILKTLLKQTNFNVDHRGRWADRLALNLHAHLKKTDEALIIVINALNDEYITGKHRLALYQRGLRITSSKNYKNTKLKRKFNKSEVADLREIPECNIKGRLLPSNNPGSKSSFISNDDFVCSVEELAINHYKQDGFHQGIHGESCIFVSIFCLLFWDIIYQSGIPDVFRTPYQVTPLDLNTRLFYEQRKSEIDERLTWICATSRDEISRTIGETWGLHFGEFSLVNWNIFTGVDQLQSLVLCVSSSILSLICGRFAKDHRHTRSGFPDLVVWNSEDKKFKVAEVKGPNDRLSPQQMLWIDFLLSIGVDAEVCHVAAVGAKKLKLRKDESCDKL